MSDKRLSPATDLLGKEIPLDLRVPRGEMYGRPDNCEFPKVIRRSNSMPSSGYQPYTRPLEQRPRFYTESDPTVGTIVPEPAGQRAAFSSPMSIDSPEYYDNGGLAGVPAYDSSILPKKRKNLWRPYDSRGLAGELETDSSSDSSLSSDQDTKSPTPPIDPIKKRKMEMLKYAQLHDRQDSGRTDVTYGTPSDKMATAYSEMDSNYTIPPAMINTSQDGDYRPNCESVGYGHKNVEDDTGKDQTHSLVYPEAGMKKRDIFGWSLRLTKPSSVTENTGENESDKDPDVCLDGEKTYFELQTVKNTPTKMESKPKTISRVRSSPAKLDNQLQAVETTGKRISKGVSGSSQSKVEDQSATSHITNKDVNNTEMNMRNPVNDTNSPVEDRVAGGDGDEQNTYIHGKDNIVKVFNEANNIPPKTKAQKGISLIDLIEEIEADTLAKEKESVENKRNINKGIAALLEQCDHVKFQALDFLMSNVLLEEKGRSYVPQNPCVQRMLRGDKIGSVNMLDVVDLAVEIGLR